MHIIIDEMNFVIIIVGLRILYLTVKGFGAWIFKKDKLEIKYAKYMELLVISLIVWGLLFFCYNKYIECLAGLSE